MKIGIDIRNIGKKRTGDEVVFFNLAKNLARIDGINSYRLFTDITSPETLAEIKKRLDIEDKNNFEIVPLKTTNKFIWNFWTLQRYLRKNPIDVYLTQYITPWFVPESIKILTVIHDISFNFYAKYINFFDLLFLKILIPLSLKRADKIIAVSRFTCDEIIKYYGTKLEKIEVVHNAVPDNFLEKIPQEKLASVRKKYNLPEKFILCIGTLQPRKNLPTLIEAYAKIKKKDPEVKLVLAGDREGHNFDANIDKAIARLNLSGAVIFPGFIDEPDKPTFFRLSTVFCFPSFYEGFGIPLLEAMVSGIPVVASKIPAHVEIAGGAALFFDPKDANALSESLLKAYADENTRNMLIKNGFGQAQKFSWKNSAEKLLDICKKLE